MMKMVEMMMRRRRRRMVTMVIITVITKYQDYNRYNSDVKFLQRGRIMICYRLFIFILLLLFCTTE